MKHMYRINFVLWLLVIPMTILVIMKKINIAWLMALIGINGTYALLIELYKSEKERKENERARDNQRARARKD